jgi:hypothetical protein
MKAPTPTTNLIKLNQLYGVYEEAVDKRTPPSQEAEKAWIEYETYVKRYKEERGMEHAVRHSFAVKTKIHAV